eukprot:IDg14542t1
MVPSSPMALGGAGSPFRSVLQRRVSFYFVRPRPAGMHSFPFMVLLPSSPFFSLTIRRRSSAMEAFVRTLDHDDLRARKTIYCFLPVPVAENAVGEVRRATPMAAYLCESAFRNCAGYDAGAASRSCAVRIWRLSDERWPNTFPQRRGHANGRLRSCTVSMCDCRCPRLSKRASHRVHANCRCPARDLCTPTPLAAATAAASTARRGVPVCAHSGTSTVFGEVP